VQWHEDHQSSSGADEACVGLAAELYDLWYGPEAGADDHYQQQLADDAGPVLEIGCGTGRQLLPALRAGLAIEGVDNSPDMLAICRRKAEQAGLTPVLHQQDVRRLDLPRRYATIFCAYGTFQLLADWDEAMTALQRIYEHLAPGGRFLVDCSIPWHELTAPRRQWRLTEVVTRPDDGATVLEHEASEADPLRQVQTLYIRHEIYQHNQLATTGLRRMRLRWFGRRELQLMLETAGFRDVTITADESINRSYYVSRRPISAE
jgi:SAM-dependent methyltransferase